MRTLTAVGLAIAALVAAPAFAPAAPPPLVPPDGVPCAWVPWLESPTLTVDDRLVFLSARMDADLAACARVRKLGFRVVWEEERGGAWVKVADDALHGPNVDGRLFPSAYCDHTPLSPRLRGRIEASGELAPAAWVSPPVDVEPICAPCDRLGRGVIGVIREDAQKVSFEGELDGDWLACARKREPKGQGRVVARVFLGGEQKDVMRAIHPDLVLPVPAKGGAIALTVPLAQVCRDATRRELSVELAGSGVYRGLGSSGRAVTRLRCAR
jgi:hypothetical protein